jgi:hypothetical protein
MKLSHEARGLSAAAAYIEAGYKENRHNAATLARKQHILGRVRELQEEQLAMHKSMTLGVSLGKGGAGWVEPKQNHREDRDAERTVENKHPGLLRARR